MSFFGIFVIFSRRSKEICNQVIVTSDLSRLIYNDTIVAIAKSKDINLGKIKDHREFIDAIMFVNNNKKNKNF